MKLTEKLMFFALGCVFVVVGQVLLNLTSEVTAQDSEEVSGEVKEYVESYVDNYVGAYVSSYVGGTVGGTFDTITCKALKIVDDNGRTGASMFASDSACYLMFFDEEGKLRISTQVVRGNVSQQFFDKEGKERISTEVSDEFVGQGFINGMQGFMDEQYSATLIAGVHEGKALIGFGKGTGKSSRLQMVMGASPNDGVGQIFFSPNEDVRIASGVLPNGRVIRYGAEGAYTTRKAVDDFLRIWGVLNFFRDLSK